MEDHNTILIIPGALRRGSFNRMLAQAALQRLLPPWHGEIFELAAIPLFNADVEAVGFPEPVVCFREAIRRSGGIIIATPEYNYSIPGVLKNALDWASRPPEQPFDGKPTAIMGASSGIFGTVRSQTHLRAVLQYLNTRTMPKPELMVARAADKFNADGILSDERTAEALGKFIDAFVKWVG